MSADIQWMILRNNSSFLVKRAGRSFSKEPNNLKGVHKFRNNGLIHRKTVGVEAAPGGKGVVLVTRRSKQTNRPRNGVCRMELKRGTRATMRAISNTLGKGGYRPDLRSVSSPSTSQSSLKLVASVVGAGICWRTASGCLSMPCLLNPCSEFL